MATFNTGLIPSIIIESMVLQAILTRLKKPIINKTYLQTIKEYGLLGYLDSIKIPYKKIDYNGNIPFKNIATRSTHYNFNAFDEIHNDYMTRYKNGECKLDGNIQECGRLIDSFSDEDYIIFDRNGETYLISKKLSI